ncbi:MAG: hypothetical protein AAF938_23180 [Myxococcota bacterium]
MNDVVLLEIAGPWTVSAFGLGLCGSVLIAWYVGRAAGAESRSLLLAFVASGGVLTLVRALGGEGTLGALSAFGLVLYLAESGRAVLPAATYAAGLLITAGVFGAIYGQPWASGLAYGHGSLARAAHEAAGLIDPASSHSLPTVPLGLVAGAAAALSACMVRAGRRRGLLGALALAAISGAVGWFRDDGFGGGELATLALLCAVVVEGWRLRLRSSAS